VEKGKKKKKKPHTHTHTHTLTQDVGSQVTNMQVLPDPTFLGKYNCNKVTIDSDTPLLFLLSLASVENMALHKSVMKDNYILCALYWMHILMCNDCEPEILYSDSDIPTTPPHKQF